MPFAIQQTNCSIPKILAMMRWNSGEYLPVTSSIHGGIHDDSSLQAVLMAEVRPTLPFLQSWLLFLGTRSSHQSPNLCLDDSLIVSHKAGGWSRLRNVSPPRTDLCGSPGIQSTHRRSRFFLALYLFFSERIIEDDKKSENRRWGGGTSSSLLVTVSARSSLCLPPPPSRDPTP